jgi:hypothetical protein
VRAETSQAVDPRTNDYFLTVDADCRLTIQNPSSKGAITLESDDQEASFRSPKIAFEVMQNAPGVAHACASQD